MYRVLMVDDDRAILDTNEAYFRSRGYQVFQAETAAKALDLARNTALDCIILDVALPGESGIDLCGRLREVTLTPIVFLSAYGDESDRIRGLLAGGDDYVCKPYSMQELELRVRIRIERRLGTETTDVLTFSGLKIDLGLREVSYHDDRGDLTTLEFDILAFLARHPGQVFSYEQLFDRVWQAPIGQSRHTLQVAVARLRQKLTLLCPDYDFIRTVRRKGYQFLPPEENEGA